MSQDGVTWKQSAAVGAIVFLIAYGALRLWSSHGHAMPQNSWFAFGVIIAMIAMVLVGGWSIREYLHGQSLRPPSPQRARRTLVAGQACALAGAVVVGWYAAHAAVFARHLEIPSDRSDFWMSLALTAVAVGLVVAGFVVQAWCRIPDDDDEERRRRQGGSGGGGAVSL